MALLRQEGKQVRQEGAVRAAKLTGPQLKEQLAARLFLRCPVTGKTLDVKRAGNKEVLVEMLEKLVAQDVGSS